MLFWDGMDYSIKKKYMSQVVSETQVVFFDIATDESTHVTTRQTKVTSGGFDPLTCVQEIVDDVLFHCHVFFFTIDLYMSEKLSMRHTHCLSASGRVLNW